MAIEKAPNYSPAQEARIREMAEGSPGGKLDLAGATALAEEFGKKARSVIAKAGRMGVPYARKEPTTKTGAPVESKSKIVTEIAGHVGCNVEALDGLEKASKAALQRVRDALAA